MASEKPEETKIVQLRSRILSDILRAELAESPVNWSRYQADFPNRIKLMQNLQQTRYLELSDNKCFMTFNGLVSLKTAEARALLSDCRKVFNALLAHYKKNLHAQVAVTEVAEKSGVSSERTVLTIRYLNRESSVQVSFQPTPFSIESNVSVNDAFLHEKSFNKMVKSRRELLAKPQFSLSNIPFGTQAFEPTAKLRDDTLQRLGSKEVREAWEKCNDRVLNDSTGAITATRSLAESACKQILDRNEIAYSNSTDLPALYGLAVKAIQLDPGKEANDAIKKILGGCATIVNGLAQLRNSHGDSHGKAPGSGQPSQRHAALATSLAGAMSAFLLATDDGRARP